MTHSTYTRNGQLRHRQSLGRQRRLATDDPSQQARAMVAWIRKRIADGQALPQAESYNGLPEAAWAELMGLLDDDEWVRVRAAINPPKFDVEARLREQTDERTEARWQVVYPRTA